MFDALSRLHRTKVVLLSLTLTIAGASLIAVENHLSTSESWLHHVPFAEIGGIIIGAGLLSVWVDIYLRREQAALDDHRLRAILTEHAPIMRDAVLDAFAAGHDDLARVSTPETLDQIITNSLALRLGDPDFADEIFTDIHDQAIDAPERWKDTHVTIDLTHPNPDGRRNKPAPFLATIRWEYTTTPAFAQRRFACVSERDEYLELTQDPGATSVWFLGETNTLNPTSTDAFELLRFTVDGPRSTHPTRRTQIRPDIHRQHRHRVTRPQSTGRHRLHLPSRRQPPRPPALPQHRPTDTRPHHHPRLHQHRHRHNHAPQLHSQHQTHQNRTSTTPYANAHHSHRHQRLDLPPIRPRLHLDPRRRSHHSTEPSKQATGNHRSVSTPALVAEFE